MNCDVINISGTTYAIHCSDNDAVDFTAYLIIKNGEAILNGTGPVKYFQKIFNQILLKIEISDLKYIILQNPFPDTCSSLNFFEKNGFKGKIVTSWRNKIFLDQYDFSSEFYIIEPNSSRLDISGKYFLQFLNTSHLFTSGSFVTYYPEDKILFSGHIFGAFSDGINKMSPENKIQSSLVFHQHFTPSREIFEKTITKLSELNIETIAPQCGYIISENISGYLERVLNAEIGMFIGNKNKNPGKEENFIKTANNVLSEIYSMFPADKIGMHLSNNGFKIDKNNFLKNDSSNETGWTDFLKSIISFSDSSIIPAIEPFVRRIASNYSIQLPEIFNSFSYTMISDFTDLKQENINLRMRSDELQIHLKQTQKQLSQDVLTGLFKKNFFEEFIHSDIDSYEFSRLDFAFFIIDLDDIQIINNKYGKERGDEILQNTAYILKNFKKSNPETAHHLIFKFSGPRFAYYISDCTKEYAVKIAEQVRNLIQDSDLFIHKITASIGVVNFSEHITANLSTEEKLTQLVDICEMRVRIAKKRGLNNTCFESTYKDIVEIENSIVLIEPDDTTANILRMYLNKFNFNIIRVKNGIDGIDEIKSKKPVIVISELFVPKSDGFMIRSNMLDDSRMKNIPFILLSHKKNSETVKRAMELEIVFYLQKPFFTEELMAIIKTHITGSI